MAYAAPSRLKTEYLQYEPSTDTKITLHGSSKVLILQSLLCPVVNQNLFSTEKLQFIYHLSSIRQNKLERMFYFFAMFFLKEFENKVEYISKNKV